MFFIFVFAFLASSLAAIVRPPNQRPLNAVDGDNCPIVKELKTLNWDFLATNNSQPIPVTRHNLESPGSGFVWRNEAYYNSNVSDENKTKHPDVTRPILFENNQGFSLVNCTYYPENDPARKGCTSPDLALLCTPGTKIGDAPPDKGKIGTIHGSKYPELSLWAVYDLIEFRLTPIVPAKYYNESITIEIFGWRENGTTTATIRTKIIPKPGYKIKLPEGEWNAIVQWQVRVWWSAGTRATRKDFAFLIDDVVIDEYALGEDYYNCKYPPQSPTGPPSSTVTLGFDDIPTNPNSSATVSLPNPYHDYSFAKGNGTWKLVNKLSYPADSPGRLNSASTGLNALLGTPKIRGRWSHDPNVITTPDFLFDIESFHISVDNATTSTDNPRDILVIVSAVGACSNNLAISYDEGAYVLLESPSYSYDIDLTGDEFKKYRLVNIHVLDYGSFQYIPFWIDNIKVKSWKGSLAIPGCERCGEDMKLWCEYPPIKRPPRRDGSEDRGGLRLI